ncbi:MAG: oxygenase MpaB family protein [Jatrophihabitans sp.]|uniref:oxygenase MpaB family protein n=1 Tax=Jatrophihabitans sp. TaxID=1932789 RepID=UPI00390E4DA6
MARPAPAALPARTAVAADPVPFDGSVYLDGVGAFLAGTANVIMQLALAPVGHGVVESTVESGQVTRHPLKRFRTTFTYISVALLGTDDERARYREAVNGQHRQVRSQPDDPVQYNAFSRDLQLWVAACMYYGAMDLYSKLYGPMPDDQADAFYEHAARFGTTLQVPTEMWPADRAAFARYWDEAVTRVAMDEPVREYLHGLMTRQYMHPALRGSVRFNTWVTTGFLPQQFRDEMRLPWSAGDQERFERVLRRLGAVLRRLPPVARRFPFNWLLWDLRVRIRLNRPLV